MIPVIMRSSLDLVCWLLLSLGVSAATSDKIFFPPSTGPWHVGKAQHVLKHTTSNDVFLPSNHNISKFIVLTVLYPTKQAPTQSTSLKYIDDKLAQSLENTWNFTSGSLQKLWTPLQWQAPPKDSRALPTLLFSPGLDVSCDLSMVMTAEMASYGYTVLCIDHPGEPPYLKIPFSNRGVSGFAINHDWESDEDLTRINEIRKSDFDAAIAAWPALVKEYKAPFNTTHFIHYGMSLGGSIGEYLVSAYPNVLGGVNYDGSFFDGFLGPRTVDVKKPFLMLHSNAHEGADPTWPDFESAQTAWWADFRVNGTKHLDFMDTKWWIELTHQKDPRTPSLTGTIKAIRCREIQSTFTRAFFDFVLGKGAGILNEPQPSLHWPDVVLTNSSGLSTS